MWLLISLCIFEYLFVHICAFSRLCSGLQVVEKWFQWSKDLCDKCTSHVNIPTAAATKYQGSGWIISVCSVFCICNLIAKKSFQYFCIVTVNLYWVHLWCEHPNSNCNEIPAQCSHCSVWIKICLFSISFWSLLCVNQNMTFFMSFWSSPLHWLTCANATINNDVITVVQAKMCD